MFARLSARFALLALVTVRPEQIAAIQSTAEAVSQFRAETRSQQIANYEIDARLDPTRRTISATQLLRWRNTSANPASTLQFHLYYNGWRNARSTWMREYRLSGNVSAVRRDEDDWASIDVASVRVIRGISESDLTHAMRFIRPDDGNPDDLTVLEIPLDAPVLPGDSITIQMAWSSRVPRTFARTGVVGNYYFVAQWFPKIGVLRDGGWNCHQFHAATEFFADFGTYDVKLTVPRGWIVGATGLERERRDGEDGTTTHHYYQEDVHDFAWTASPAYLEFSDVFQHPTLPSVRMRLLLQPEHQGQEDRHFQATKAALKYYGEWFGPYPYGHVTIVDPAWQSGADGMEYPTLFTAGTRWLAPRRVTQPESVTVHEAGHQFWYGIVATNEFEHAWMDEGLNTFSTARVMAQAFEPNYVVGRYFGGFVPWVFQDLLRARANGSRSLASYRTAARADLLADQTFRYWPATAAATSYHKTSLWLHTLERLLGWETLQRILSAYFQRWAFRHPSPQDFFAIVNDVSGRDLSWLSDQVHRGSALFDYGIDHFQSERDEDKEHEIRVSPVFNRADTAENTYRTTVVVRRYGEGIFPVDIRVLFDNNEEVRWHWDGRDRWKLFEVTKPVRARRADVDPERVLMLDVSVTNNSALVEAVSSRAATKWSLAWLIWLQDHLLTYGFFI